MDCEHEFCLSVSATNKNHMDYEHEFCLSVSATNKNHMDCEHESCLSVFATNKNHMDSGLDTSETSHCMQIISSLLNASYSVVIRNIAVWAMASFCIQ